LGSRIVESPRPMLQLNPGARRPGVDWPMGRAYTFPLARL
jgi:hypothetical protein